MINCESQECGRHGFSIINTDSCQLIGCQSETNGMFCTNIKSYGYYLKNNRCLTLIGSVANQGLVGYIKIPIYYDGGFDNNITISAQVLEYGPGPEAKIFEKLCEIYNYNPSNKIIINNNEFLKADYENSLFAYDSDQSVADGFLFEKAGITNASASKDYLEKSQKLSIYYSSADSYEGNCKICKYFNIDSSNFNTVGISVLGKTDSLVHRPYLRLRFLNSQDEEISLKLFSRGANYGKFLTQWLSYYGSDSIPTGTKKIKIELFIANSNRSISEQANANCWFKDFKIVFYNS